MQKPAPRAPSRLRCLFALAFINVVAACGGGSDVAVDPPPPPSAAPGGVYVGYYQEDPTDNPEDPTVGTLFLSLPDQDASFSGSMSFTYAGCQSDSIGTISGTKTAQRLDGQWSGSVDEHPESGGYSGAFDGATGMYQGTYTIAGGKQHIVVPECIDFYIASHGRFELVPVSSSLPKDFHVDVSGTVVRWTNPAATGLVLVSVIDQAAATAGDHSAVKYQQVGFMDMQSIDLAAVPGLPAGRSYIVSVSALSDTLARLSLGSAVVKL